MRWLLIFTVGCSSIINPPPVEDDFPLPGPVEPVVDGPPPLPDACTPFGEATCLSTKGCHASYAQDGSGAFAFLVCARIDGPATAGDCSTMSEQMCGFRDDCVTDRSMPDFQGSTQFLFCAAEPQPA
jgi:hypothetical protein